MYRHPVTQGAAFEGTERFEIIRRLGAGGMGVVYEAHDRERDVRVALKTLRQMDGAALLRFKNEFRALCDLQHENLVRLGELQALRETWFFTMELVRGKDFIAYVRPGATERVRAEDTTPDTATTAVVGVDARTSFTPEMASGRLDEGRLRAALAQLAAGLSALHAASMVHRDVKPSNVIVTNEGRVVLLDFGLVTGTHDPEQVTEAFAGTVPYMAPEQASGGPVGPEADWYAVGVMLYEALTGRVPFHGSAFEILSSKRTSAPENPRTLAPDAPEDLCALCMDLLRPRPADRARAEHVLARLGVKRSIPPATDAPFVGRERELDQLEKAWRASRDGRAVTVYVHGESGVGKTALVRTFAAQLAAKDPSAVVLSGRCYERESVPYKAVDGIVDALSRLFGRMPKGEVLDLLPPSAVLCAQLFPVLGRHLEGQAPESGLDPAELRTRAFVALREILERVARKLHVLVVIDDLQWADPDSLVALRDVMTPPAPPVMLVATVRTTTTGESTRSVQIPTSRLNVGSSSMPGDVRDIPLGRLGRGEAIALARATVARIGASDGEATAIAEEAGGHPLFIDELARHAALSGRAAPVKLEDAVWSRIRAQDPLAQELVVVACVAGSPLPHAAAVFAAGFENAEQLDRAIASLRAQHLLRTTRRRGAPAVEPYHDRVRQAVMGALGDDVRAIHDKLARGLERANSADHEALATHWFGAGHRARAKSHAMDAANAAFAALAFDRAARLYAWAIDLDPPEPAELSLIERKRGEALAFAGRGHEAARAFLAAAEHASESDAIDLRRRAAEQLLLSGRIDEGLGVLREVLAALGMEMPRSPSRSLASIAYRRARLALRGLSFEKHPSKPELLRKIDVCWSASMGLGFVDTIRGADFHLRGLLLALGAGDAHRASRALAIESVYLAGAGSEATAWNTMLDRALEIARSTGDRSAIGLVKAAGGMASYLAGEFRRARFLAEEAIALLREGTNVQWQLGLVRHFWLRTLWLLGEAKPLTSELCTLLRDAENRGDLFLATNLRTGDLNVVWLLDDDPEAARAELDLARSALSTQGVHLQHVQELYARAVVDLYERQGEAALRRIDGAWPSFERAGHFRVVSQAIALRSLRARACVAAMRQKNDPRLLERATADANDIARTGAPWALAIATLLRGCIADAAKDATRARASFEIAARDLAACDMAIYAEIAKRRLAEIDGRSTEEIDRLLEERGVKKPEPLARTIAP
jgi:tetratricopeptide (TPR) repeat protein